LDAGAPHNGKVLGGRLWFEAEEEAEKIPVGFDSKKSLAVIDENCNVANRIGVEMMKLKPVVKQKALKEGTRGEGQSPFGKMEKCDDFVNTFHGERFTVRGAPVDKVLLLQQPLGN
jgi:hypothetical protein